MTIEKGPGLTTQQWPGPETESPPENSTDSQGPLTLAVTSSTGVVGVALGRVSSGKGLFNDVQLLAANELATERRHAEELSPALHAMLAKASCEFGDLEKLVVDVGPGRFTGLRVGLATVKGLAFALGLPVVGLSSLEILAGTEPGGPVTAVIDARREEVFQQRFVDGIAVGEPMVGSAADVAGSALGRTVGDGVDRYIDSYIDQSDITIVRSCNPQAVVMLSLSGRYPGVPGAEIEPIYIRDPDASPNIKTRPTGTDGVAVPSKNPS